MIKSLKRWLPALALAVILALGCVLMLPATYTASAEAGGQTVEVTVYYYRPDGNYSGWDIWNWTKDTEGSEETVGLFTSTASVKGKTFGVSTFTSQTIAADNQIGFIVRTKGSWAEKDTGGDRFMDASKAVDGKLSVWLVAGEKTVYYSEEEVDVSPKFTGAYFSDEKKINFEVSEAFAEGFAFTLKADGEDVEMEKNTVTAGKKAAAVYLKNAIDMGKNYVLADVNTDKDTGYGSVAVSKNKLFDNESFVSAYGYDGELGAVYAKDKTVFRVWSPFSSAVTLNLYEAGEGGTAQTVSMTKGAKGVFEAAVSGDLNGKYYTFTVAGDPTEIVDPYARSGGVNGKRGMVLDLDSTNPDGWETHTRPRTEAYVDAVIYETHVRDLTIDPSSGVSAANRGKFLGMTETGTVNSYGESTALDHLKDLGITELHILPMFDYGSVDESKPDVPQFNWGYDPVNYNFPEGSYSTDPYKGEVRVKELKQMIMTLHNNGIRVVMDVVYNHTYDADKSNFQHLAPNYYYRMNGNQYYNGSGCGNETASERYMFRKFMVDSVKYWAEEYKIDGFRFDLMGLHDITTMNLIAEELQKIDDGIIIYGEGWTAGTSGLSAQSAALKGNAKKTPDIAYFNDDTRDGLKGSVFDEGDRGFVSGKTGMENAARFSVTGAVNVPGVGYKPAWAGNPGQSINYVSSHDNHTLWDKLSISAASATEEERIKMDKLAAAMVFTAQGVPFFLSGEEILRSKPVAGGGVSHNSYNLPDSTNSIKWDDKHKNMGVYDYYKGLIALRKALPQLRLRTAEEITNSLTFLEDLPEGVIGYQLKADGKTLALYFNQNKEAVSVNLPGKDSYGVYADGSSAGASSTREVKKTAQVDAISALILVRNEPVGGCGCGSVAFTGADGLFGGLGALLLGVVLLIILKSRKRTLKGAGN